MTKKNVRPIELPAASARGVGQLIMTRATRLPLAHTPLRDLPSAGRKLLRAARARPSSTRTIKLWNLTKSELECLFHYLVLYFHPDNDNAGLLDKRQTKYARSVALAAAKVVLAKPGKSRLPRADAEYVIATHEEVIEKTLPAHVLPPDPAQVRKLKKRIDFERKLAGTRLAKIPWKLQILIAKNYP